MHLNSGIWWLGHCLWCKRVKPVDAVHSGCSAQYAVDAVHSGCSRQWTQYAVE